MKDELNNLGIVKLPSGFVILKEVRETNGKFYFEYEMEANQTVEQKSLIEQELGNWITQFLKFDNEKNITLGQDGD